MDFNNQLKIDQAQVEAQLAQYFEPSNPLEIAMQYAVLNGGKRLRAHLVYETARLFGVAESVASAGAKAIELLHAYSLVHDDLPAMDNDDLRRGKPTVHVKWNEWTAILVGDGLQAKAFEQLTAMPLGEEPRLRLISTMATCAGAMVRGQFLDLDAENRAHSMTLEEIRAMQSDKTGALIAWSACFGARAVGGDEKLFVEYANALGLAFQIWDDVLDIEGKSETLGKTAGKDTTAGKATFVSHLGMSGAKQEAAQAVERAKAAIDGVPNSNGLRDLADFVINRRN